MPLPPVRLATEHRDAAPEQGHVTLHGPLHDAQHRQMGLGVVRTLDLEACRFEILP